jgi:hypothetical protein
MRPPNPEPAVDSELAKERRLSNHCGTTPTVAVKAKPMPMPKQMPCDRRRCQILEVKDAPMKETASNTIPILSVVAVPSLRMHIVAMGETRRAIETESPPTNANDSGEAPGKVPEFR